MQVEAPALAHWTHKPGFWELEAQERNRQWVLWEEIETATRPATCPFTVDFGLWQSAGERVLSGPRQVRWLIKVTAGHD